MDENTDIIPKIKRIKKNSIHRICSGQVVLDLAGAVKELVENSLDCGANSIEVRLKEHGAVLIEVADNGPGISAENYWALTRKYYTSKISEYEDLERLSSFGFRGEALSALCALAEVAIITRTSDDSVATRLDYDHSGQIVSKGFVARAVGTTVSVSNLFSPLPVRYNEFRRNVSGQFKRLTTVLQAYALIAKRVRLICSNYVHKVGRRVFIQTTGSLSMRENVVSVFGTATLASLDWLNLSVSDECRVEGFAGPGPLRGSGGPQFIYINGRPVDMPKVVKLMNSLYREERNLIKPPLLILNFMLPATSYDINLSPDKRKVLIQGESDLVEALRLSMQKFFKNVFLRNSASGSPEEPSGPKMPMKVNSCTNIKHSSVVLAEDCSGAEEEDEEEDDEEEDEEADNEVSEEVVSGKSRKGDHGLKSKDVYDKYRSVVPAEDCSGGEEEDNQAINEVTNHLSFRHDSTVDAHDNPNNGGLATTSAFLDPDSTHSSLMSLFKRKRLQAQESTAYPLYSRPEVDATPFIRRTDEVETSSPLNSLREGPRDDCPGRNKVCSGKGGQVAESSCVSTEGRPGVSIARPLVGAKPVGVGSTHLGETSKSSRSKKRSAPQLQTKLFDLNGGELGGARKRGSRLRAEQGSEEPVSVLQFNRLSAVEVDEAGRLPKNASVIPFDMENIRRKLSCRLLENENCKDSESTFLRRSFEAATVGMNRCEKQGATEALVEAATEELGRELNKADFKRMQVIGQVDLRFILAKLDHNVFVLDQHASDEKYNYECLLRTSVSHCLTLKRPLPLRLDPADDIIVTGNIETFRQNGFHVGAYKDATGAHELRLGALPSSNTLQFGVKDVHELVSIIKNEGKSCDPEKRGSSTWIPRPSRVKELFASQACKSSIKTGDALSKQEMELIVSHMAELDSPWTCPHGGPTIRHLVDLRLVTKPQPNAVDLE